MMESVSVGHQATLSDQLAALPFTAAPAPPFRIVDSFAGIGLAMTVGARDVDPEGTQPSLIIVYDPDIVDDPAELRTNPRPARFLGNPQVESRTQVTFAGLDGILLNGRCDGHRRFSQYMAVTSENKMITLAFVTAESDFGGLEPAVETIANSVSMKRN
jgi:hypothetical protein